MSISCPSFCPPIHLHIIISATLFFLDMFFLIAQHSDHATIFVIQPSYRNSLIFRVFSDHMMLHNTSSIPFNFNLLTLISSHILLKAHSIYSLFVILLKLLNSKVLLHCTLNIIPALCLATNIIWSAKNMHYTTSLYIFWMKGLHVDAQ